MAQWWKEQVVYQIYPRSFQDSNGDGIGDIPGIISRLDEIKALGAGILWLSPVYRSPDADNGYDISDYRDIDPRYGTLADMDRLFAEAKARDLKIIMDLVINHTSDEHEWFQKSRERVEPYTDYYIWRPAKPDGSPPNNWTGFFMGSTWEWDDKRGEYYLHLFDRKQPDLNYHNPKVIDEAKGILRFWLDRGAAGFRCDVINVIYKTSLSDGRRRIAIRGIEHYKSQEGNHRILQELRREVLDKYDCFTVGETVMVAPPEARLLCEPERGELDMVFYFNHLEVDRRVARYVPKPFRAWKLLQVFGAWQKALSWNALYLENHDQPRIVSHYGNDRAHWAQSAKMLATMEFTLRGTPFVYQGQEIGMTNFDFQELAELNDVESRNIDKLMSKLHIPERLRWKWISMASRDNARTPMQWTADAGAGFTTGKPWLGINHNHTRINYAAEEADPDSVLHYYRKMIALRASSDTLKFGSFTPLHANRRVMAYLREGEGERLVTVLNFSDTSVKVKHRGQVVIDNLGRETFDGILAPYEAVVLRLQPGR